MAFDFTLFSNTQAHPETVASLIRFIRHVLGSEKRLKRVDGEVDEVLAEPLRKLLAMKPIPQIAGRQWIYEIGKEMKIVGDVGPEGELIIRTLYGRGNPVDRRRNSVNITDMLV